MTDVGLIKTLAELISSGNPIITTVASIIMVILLLVFGIVSILDVYKKVKDLGIKVAKRERKPDDIKKRIRSDITIQNILRDVVIETDSDRAMLLQFHNGIIAKSGMPFEFAVVTHEYDREGVAKNDLHGSHLDIRLFSQFSDNMLNNRIFIGRTEELNNPVKAFLKRNGDRRLCFRMLTDAIYSDFIIGALVLTKITDTDWKDDKKLESIITRSSDMCSGVLSSTWGSCDRCERKTLKGKEGCTKKEQRDNELGGSCTRYKQIIVKDSDLTCD